MFRKLKHYYAARETRRKLLKRLEEIRNEDLFTMHPNCQSVVIQSEERLKAINTIKIQVSQVKRYKKRIPVRVGVA